jgi:hypothetical protein
MNTQLATTRSTAIAVPTEVSPWREAANEEQGANFGTLLKFVKGEWLLGEEQKGVSPTTMFIANMNEYWRGWVKWVDKEPVAHLIGRVVDRHRVHLREELGDLDQFKWESDGNGVKRDPWQRAVYLVMRNSENDDPITFTSGSDGGRKAVAKLCDRYDRLRHKFPAQMPVVVLASESYQHREYGKVLKPKFNVVGWDYWDEDAKKDPDGTLQQQHAAEMSDEIPF